MKTIFAICLASCFVLVTQTGCLGRLLPSPDRVEDNIWAIDSSTPDQYDSTKGGFLGFVGDDGLITTGLRAKYNALVSLYEDQFFEVKVVRLEKDAGVRLYTDQYGNKLYLIDQEHLVYFIILKQWSNELLPPDK